MCNLAQISDSSLWHQRLGHPSTKVTSLFSSFHFKNKACDTNECLVCPLTKQIRLPFPSSSINSASCFDLIHVDIWGGYKVASISRANIFLPLLMIILDAHGFIL